MWKMTQSILKHDLGQFLKIDFWVKPSNITDLMAFIELKVIFKLLKLL